MPKKVKTPDEVRAEFLAEGLTISDWARRNGYKPRDVSLVLNGQIKGRYGRGHEIAVKLGLKKGSLTNNAASAA